jgi:hypothetical protein
MTPDNPESTTDALRLIAWEGSGSLPSAVWPDWRSRCV